MATIVGPTIGFGPLCTVPLTSLSITAGIVVAGTAIVGPLLGFGPLCTVSLCALSLAGVAGGVCLIRVVSGISHLTIIEGISTMTHTLINPQNASCSLTTTSSISIDTGISYTDYIKP